MVIEDDDRVSFTVNIPEFNLQKHLSFGANDSVWVVKLHLLSSISKDLKEGFNYGLYMVGCNGKAGKFLEEHRPLLHYPSLNQSPHLEFRMKRRVYKSLVMTTKKAKQLSSKSTLKELISLVNRGDENSVRRLLSRGVDPNFIYLPSGETPLTHACLRNMTSIISILVEGGAHLDYRNKRGLTPLHCAAMQASHMALQALLDLGASPDLLDLQSHTPLLLATAYKAPIMSIHSLLFEHADPNQTDQQLNTPLHLASRIGLASHARLLLRYGARINNQNNIGNTALHLAVINNQVEVVIVLLESGADTMIRNMANKTPLEAALQPCTPIIQAFHNHFNYPTVVTMEPPTYNKKRRMLKVRRSTSNPHLAMADDSASYMYSGFSLGRKSQRRNTDLGNLQIFKDFTNNQHFTDLDAPRKPIRQQFYECQTLQSTDQNHHKAPAFNTFDRTPRSSTRHPNVFKMRSLSLSSNDSRLIEEIIKRDSPLFNKKHEMELGEDYGKHKEKREDIKEINLLNDKQGYGFVLRGARSSSSPPPLEQKSFQFIESVQEGSKAYDAGVRSGDFLIKVNGEDVTRTSHEKTVQLIRQATSHLKLIIVPGSSGTNNGDIINGRAGIKIDNNADWCTDDSGYAGYDLGEKSKENCQFFNVSSTSNSTSSKNNSYTTSNSGKNFGNDSFKSSQFIDPNINLDWSKHNFSLQSFNQSNYPYEHNSTSIGLDKKTPLATINSVHGKRLSSELPPLPPHLHNDRKENKYLSNLTNNKYHTIDSRSHKKKLVNYLKNNTSLNNLFVKNNPLHANKKLSKAKSYFSLEQNNAASKNESDEFNKNNWVYGHNFNEEDVSKESYSKMHSFDSNDNKFEKISFWSQSSTSSTSSSPLSFLKKKKPLMPPPPPLRLSSNKESRNTEVIDMKYRIETNSITSFKKGSQNIDYISDEKVSIPPPMILNMRKDKVFNVAHASNGDGRSLKSASKIDIDNVEFNDGNTFALKNSHKNEKKIDFIRLAENARLEYLNKTTTKHEKANIQKKSPQTQMKSFNKIKQTAPLSPCRKPSAPPPLPPPLIFSQSSSTSSFPSPTSLTSHPKSHPTPSHSNSPILQHPSHFSSPPHPPPLPPPLHQTRNNILIETSQNMKQKQEHDKVIPKQSSFHEELKTSLLTRNLSKNKKTQNDKNNENEILKTNSLSNNDDKNINKNKDASELEKTEKQSQGVDFSPILKPSQLKTNAVESSVTTAPTSTAVNKPGTGRLYTLDKFKSYSSIKQLDHMAIVSNKKHLFEKNSENKNNMKSEFIDDKITDRMIQKDKTQFDEEDYGTQIKDQSSSIIAPKEGDVKVAQTTPTQKAPDSISFLSKISNTLLPNSSTSVASFSSKLFTQSSAANQPLFFKNATTSDSTQILSSLLPTQSASSPKASIKTTQTITSSTSSPSFFSSFSSLSTVKQFLIDSLSSSSLSSLSLSPSFSSSPIHPKAPPETTPFKTSCGVADSTSFSPTSTPALSLNSSPLKLSSSPKLYSLKSLAPPCDPLMTSFEFNHLLPPPGFSNDAQANNDGSQEDYNNIYNHIVGSAFENNETSKEIYEYSVQNHNEDVLLNVNDENELVCKGMAFHEPSGKIKKIRDWSICEVSKWLAAMGMQHHIKNFQANCIDGRVMESLGRGDLIQLGVEKVGERMAIERGIKRIFLNHYKK